VAVGSKRSVTLPLSADGAAAPANSAATNSIKRRRVVGGKKMRKQLLTSYFKNVEISSKGQQEQAPAPVDQQQQPPQRPPGPTRTTSSTMKSVFKKSPNETYILDVLCLLHKNHQARPDSDKTWRVPFPPQEQLDLLLPKHRTPQVGKFAVPGKQQLNKYRDSYRFLRAFATPAEHSLLKSEPLSLGGGKDDEYKTYKASIDESGRLPKQYSVCTMGTVYSSLSKINQERNKKGKGQTIPRIIEGIEMQYRGKKQRKGQG
jgi:hypothetical protein